MFFSRAMRAARRQASCGELAGLALRVVLPLLAMMLLAAPMMAQAEQHGGGEANLVLPDLNMAARFWAASAAARC